MRQRAARVDSQTQVARHFLGGGEIDAVDEHREVPEEPPLVVGQQVVGPLDGRPQRAVPVLGGSPPATEQVQRPVQPRRQVSEGERGQPACGELDGQRHPVEGSHDRGDQAPVLAVAGEPRPDAGRAVDEERHRGAGLGPPVVRSGQRERRQAGRAFGGEPERLPAGGQHGERGAAVEQGGDGVAHGVEDVLAVVDQQQVGAGGQYGDAGREHVPVHHREPQRGGQRVGDRARVGDQPLGAEQPPHRSHLRFPSDERGGRAGRRWWHSGRARIDRRA
ncbi:MAG: hypothetical protein L0I24_05690, partial [Pseudonocardia sp.]|nr:hypothetical protein [Pseudonocardia sp.]